jgi:hypothetical protein
MEKNRALSYVPRRSLSILVRSRVGLSVDLQNILLCLEFTSFDQLTEATERHDTALEQREARKKR